MIKSRKSPEEIVFLIENWIRQKTLESSSCGGVVGLSGGIDSAVVAVLLRRVFGENMLAIKMPCHSIEEDNLHADLLIEKFDLPWALVDLSETYDSLVKAVKLRTDSLAVANIKPRLRMTTLYAFAQSHGYLVCGTGNKAELTVGYFTKHGDSGVDLLPLGDLTKSEVRDVAEYLDIPSVIVEKAPSAGLWEGQTDEIEMGLSYDQIDNFIIGQTDGDKTNEIQTRFNSTKHKREIPPICELF
ncbi:NAD(+) synthase [Dethiosulfovibrio salsuginis]|uniref:NH(3)-dependent NAD(+) synthetase n=1 Tax=Dethiosulfovibrio salsuginis TaxID=561720 RepID=A0A1X7I518_9BACT|nr:NAD(+) synthase [Dethiosulfovibrio salsuginis]SMG08936.1 NAD+ synthase [Dethiosulfovibrio salsuginis]